jgi:methyl-accepting chemotaxis protein
MSTQAPVPTLRGTLPRPFGANIVEGAADEGDRSTQRALIASIAGTVILLICGTVLALWRESPAWFITVSHGLCLVAAVASAGFTYLLARTAPAKALILGQRLAQTEADLTAATAQVADQQSQIGRLEADFASATAQSGGVLEKLRHAILEINAADTAQLEHCVLVNGKIEEGSKEAANAADVLSTLDENARGLASTSQQMSTNISVVATAAEEISSNINTCASTTEQISSNMSNVATTVEQMSSNLATIDSALRELSTAISGIAENAREGAAVAGNAAKASDATTDTMSLLGKSAEEIGKVTNVIQIIAQQTNLLALNAAIEAASAGEAGKGFAVVANEVKELAKQTTAATEDIAVKIQSIQANTARAVLAIRDITGIVNKINDLQGMIAKTVEQQKNATQEISRNVSEAVAGINQISKNVNEAADGASQSSKSIGEIASGANEVAKNIAEAAAGASSLNGKIAEAAVMVTEASRYTRHASTASRETREAMQQMLIAVDRVCDAVRELEADSGTSA